MNRATAVVPRAGRILVVEDEPDVAELLRYHLGREGYAVLLAPTGGEVVRRARDARPDVILLDVMVPQLNGWDRISGSGTSRSIATGSRSA